MNYFKHDGVVIKAKSAPLIGETSSINAIINGWLVPLSSVPPNSTPQGVVVEGEPWEEATELEYLIYQSLNLQLLSYQPKAIRDLMWALNNADKTDLRLGVKAPSSNEPVAITRVREKHAIVSLTQHGQGDDVPSLEKSNNSTWTNWIIAKRLEQDFILVKSVNDVSFGAQ